MVFGRGPEPGVCGSGPFAVSWRGRVFDRENCACNLRPGCRQVVFGEGHQNAAVVFIGEASGGEEDRLGVSFCGSCGEAI